MNDLFSGSFSRFKSSPEHNRSSDPRQPPAVQMSAMGANLDRFFEDVEGIKDELKEIDSLHRHLHQSHENLKTIHNASAIKSLRSQMDSDVSAATKKAKLIKLKLEALDRSNASNRTQPGCGPGSSSDRTRTSVVSGLRKKLKDSMEAFNVLRLDINSEYKDTVKRRVYTITGETADDRMIETLIDTGRSESLLQRAIQDQGRGQVMDTVSEIQERHDAVKDMEKSLMELHQVFLDMAVLVEVQGEQLDDIESQVGRASSFVTRGAEQLEVAKRKQRSTRKWTCIAIVILLIVILIIVLPIVLRNTGGNGGGNSNPTPNPTPAANPPPSNPTPAGQ